MELIKELNDELERSMIEKSKIKVKIKTVTISSEGITVE